MRKKLSGLKKIILPLLVLPFVGFNASAKDLDFTAYWSGPFRSSYHFDRSEKLNEENGIWGLGIKLNEDWEIFGLRYINSYGNLSNLVGGEKNLYSGKWVDLGAEGFLVDGYPQNNNKSTPGLAGIIKFKYKNLGLKLHVFPPTKYTTEYLGLKSLENIPLIAWTAGYDFKF